MYSSLFVQNLQRHLADAGYDASALDRSAVQDTTHDPLTYTARDAIRLAQQAFKNFVDKITVHGTEAVVHYSIPLPQDSPLPGARTQTITMPAQVLT